VHHKCRLRIGDAVTLERNRINGDKLFLYTAKTGTPVYLPLPDFVLRALEAVPTMSIQYFFRTGESKIQSATGDWQRTLKGVFEIAGIPDDHAHRFRNICSGASSSSCANRARFDTARSQQYQGD
jgi:integrase